MTQIKIIALAVLIFIIFFGLTGCGNEDTQGIENNTNTPTDEVTEQLEPEDEQSDSVGGGNIGDNANRNTGEFIGGSLTGFWRAGAANAFMELPPARNFQYHGVNVREYDNMFIVAGYVKRRQYPLNTYTSSNVIERHRNEIITGMRLFFSSEGISGAPGSFAVSSQENITISGMAMTRSTGQFSTSQGQRYFMAYSTIYNGSPVYVIGMAGVNSQSQNAINQRVYDIILSLRDKR